jgi:DNA-binding CsgD family transcriptional regulator
VLGLAAEDRGDLARARAIQEALIDLAKRLREPFWTTVATATLGRLARLRGDLAGAKRHLDEALALCRATKNRHVEVAVLTELSEIALQRGEHAEAVTLLMERLEHGWDARGLHGALDGLAAIALARGEHALAARLFGAAETARQRLGIVLAPNRQKALDAKVAAARAALGETAFAAAWDEGGRMSPDDARAEAAKVAGPTAPPKGRTAIAGPADPAASLGLTRREREVLRLLAEGRSDREIAEALFISPKTVGIHMTRILDKLGVPSRAAVVAYAHRRGLV